MILRMPVPMTVGHIFANRKEPFGNLFIRLIPRYFDKFFPHAFKGQGQPIRAVDVVSLVQSLFTCKTLGARIQTISPYAYYLVISIQGHAQSTVAPADKTRGGSFFGCQCAPLFIELIGLII